MVKVGFEIIVRYFKRILWFISINRYFPGQIYVSEECLNTLQNYGIVYVQKYFARYMKTFLWYETTCEIGNLTWKKTSKIQ